MALAMERPTLRQLEILAEVARIGTFRGAARHLGLSQVAVSDHIRQLEARLDCALFIRVPGSKPALSPSGRIVLEHGRNVLFACDALISAARGAAGLAPVAGAEREPLPPEQSPVGMEKATLSSPPLSNPALLEESVNASVVEEGVGYSDSYAEDDVEAVPSDAPPAIDALAVPTGKPEPTAQPVAVSLFDAVRDAPVESPVAVNPEPILEKQQTDTEKPITVASHPAILSRFQDKLAAAQEAFPDRPIAVDFARFTPETVAPALSSGRSDIALFYALGEVPGLSSDYLWSENWSLFARADHPLAQADSLRLADCVDMPVILFDDSNPLRALCEACLAGGGLWPAPTVLETDDFSAIVTELMEYGEAVFPAFGVTAAQFAARPGLRRLALVEPLPGVQVRRAVSVLAQDDPTVAALAGLLC